MGNLLVALALVCELTQAAELSPGKESLVLSYDTPGGANTALPLGNGEIGVSAWVEPSGDLVMLIGRTDTWDEQSRLLKLGKVRVKLDTPLSTDKSSLRQRVDMGTGTLFIESTLKDNPQAKASVRVWVDANHPVIHLDVTSDRPIGVTSALEVWRTKERALSGQEVHAIDALAAREPVREWPDIVVDAPSAELKNHVVWYHHNEKSLYPVSLKVQGLEEFHGEDPLLHRTFGCAIGGAGFEAKTPTVLASAKPATNHTLTFHPLTRQVPTADAWMQTVGNQVKTESVRSKETCYAAHVEWWRNFWRRSWIDVGGKNPKEQEEIADINTGWHAYRYLNACGGRGNFPIKFNGGIFVVENPGNNARSTADFRTWGSAYWNQNTRHIYWPMLQAGDYDMMLPFFRVYRDALALAKKRTEIYYGHSGAFFPEVMQFWGTHLNQFYGWVHGKDQLGLTANGYIRLHWQGGLEVSAMMLDYYRHTQDKNFLEDTLLPFAPEIVTFYDKHYKRDAGGKMFISPAQVLESYWEADNPMPEIAGLRCVVPGLLALPEGSTTAEQRREWKRILNELPPLPQASTDGKECLVDAQAIRGGHRNRENGRLYAIWPYRLCGVGMPELETARNGWTTRPFPFAASSCWHNDIIWGAYLGLPDEARHALSSRFVMSGANRFPAMYVNGDWVPDLDNGGVCQSTVQAMLMQTVGNRILLFPAWPKDWDARFKLHATQQTTVECELRDGQIVKLEVLPASRRKDVEIMEQAFMTKIGEVSGLKAEK